MIVANSSADIQKLENLIKQVDFISLDTETSGLDPYTSNLLLIQIKVGDEIFVLDIRELDNIDLVDLIDFIKSSGVVIIGHNLKHDIKFIFHATGILLNKLHDTMIAESILTAGVGKYLYSLADLTESYLGVVLDKDTREEFIGATEITQEMIIYAAKDVLYLADIRSKQLQKITELRLTKVMDLEMDLVPVITKMEYDGVLVDIDGWKKLEEENRQKEQEYDSKIKPSIWEAIENLKFKNALDLVEKIGITKINGGNVSAKFRQKMLEEITDKESLKDIFLSNFNSGSPAQLLAALNLAGIPVKSTGQKVLGKVSGNPITENILKYREYAKLVSTYGESFVEVVNPVTGRIHTDFNQVGTFTGRWASSRPNVHNIPRSNKFRHLFLAKPGYKLITADFNQQELKLAGAISREPKFIEAYLDNIDLHTLTASFLFNKSIKSISKDERWIGKTMNFAVVYGTTAWGLSYNFDIPLEEGEDYLNKFFSNYNILGGFIEAAGNKILELKYSRTPLGRIRFFEDKKVFKNWNEKEKYDARIKREGVNMIVQGAAADMTKGAVLEIFNNNPFGIFQFRPILQVHDEVVVEVKEEIAEEAKGFIISTMERVEQPMIDPIPAKADAFIADYWTKG